MPTCRPDCYGTGRTLAAGQEVEVLRANAARRGLALTGNEFDNVLEGEAETTS